MSLICKLKQNKNDVRIVLYHENCHDGFGAAYIAWRYFALHSICPAADSKSIQYIPCGHSLGASLLAEIAGKHVLAIDICLSVSDVAEAIISANTFVVLDHHPESAKIASMFPENVKYSSILSGIGLAWDYFYGDICASLGPRLIEEEYSREYLMPEFLWHIQKRDLGLPLGEDEHAFTAYFYRQPRDFTLWANYDISAPRGCNISAPLRCDIAVQCGHEYIKLMRSLFDEMLAANSCRQTISLHQPMNVACYQQGVNVPNNISILIVYDVQVSLKDEIGLYLLGRGEKLAALVSYNYAANKSSISLRAADPYNAGEIAKARGGGGHAYAAAFTYAGRFERF